MSMLAKLAACLALWVLSAGWAMAAMDEAADSVDVAALRAAVQVERTRTPSARFGRADFLVKPAVRAVTLSPDGKRLAWIQQRDGQRSVWTMLLANDQPRRLQGQTTARALSWTRDSRWLLLETPREVFALAATDQTGSGIVASLGGSVSRTFVAADPVSAAAALMLERTRPRLGRAERWQLLRIMVGGTRAVLHDDLHQISDFAFDRSGRLAFIQRVEGEALVTYRIGAEGAMQRVLRCERLHHCSLLSRTDDRGRLLLREDLGGDLQRLSRLQPDGSLQTLHVDPRGEGDLAQVVVDPADGAPRIVTYRSTVAMDYGLDPAAERSLSLLAARLPGRNLDIEPAHGKTAPWLVAERAATLQGTRWWMFDPATGKARRVLDLAPSRERDGRVAHWLPETAMARKLHVAWRASDGMRLHGFLWLPPGRDPRALPLVTLVHGGPWNNVSPGEFGAGYSQFLANRGYAVFEPNFRASTGYGRNYLFAAHGDFGNGRVQQDIVEGARWLLANGVGDTERVGIAGASFGGYSTLLGITFQPELFKVGVAIVPPTDFAWDLRWVGRSREARNLSRYIPFEAWLRMLSLDLAGASMARLHAQSPLANAARMQRPLLLFAGGEDHRVAIRGVLGYAATLRTLGRDFSLFVDPKAAHSNDAPLAHEAYLYLLALVLHDHIGGDAPSPPDPELREYLRRSMRLAGPELRAILAHPTPSAHH